MVLRKASEIEEREGSAGSGGLSLEDLQEIAREVGIAPEAIAKAADGLDTGRVRTHLLAGAPAAYKAVHAVRGELNDEALGQLIGLMDDETDSAGAISEALGTVRWAARDRFRTTQVSRTPQNGETVVQVVEKVRPRLQRLTLLLPTAWATMFAGGFMSWTDATAAGTAAAFVAAALAGEAAGRFFWNRALRAQSRAGRAPRCDAFASRLRREHEGTPGAGGGARGLSRESPGAHFPLRAGCHYRSTRHTRGRRSFSMSSAIRPTRWVLLSLLALALLPTMASATWSVIAIDARTGRLIVASATCVPQGRFAGFPAKGLMDIQAIVVPGIGVAAAQAGVDGTRENQRLIYAQLKAGTHPEQILALLKADPNIERRQFGIIDRQGRSAGFSGSGNSPASLSVQARVPGTNIYYSVQGNILASDAVVHDAARALEQTQGTLADRVMAAMEAADEAGGDVRCTCEREPLPDAPCDSKNAHVAYILAADDGDAEGHSFNDGDYDMYINVTDDDIQRHENANPVITLRMRYDAWKADQRRGK